MVENSAIEWTDHTFNPWVGCTKVSPACDHCYAEGWAKRTGQSHLWTGERRRTAGSYWKQPFAWDRKAKTAGRISRVFCASLADVFDNKAPAEWRDDLWNMIAATPNLDWQLLTKRPQNIAKMLPEAWDNGWPNVWLGTTVENQEEADRRIPHLLAVPAAKRFLSCEPLFGPLDLLRTPRPGDTWDWLTGERETAREKTSTARIDWVICGGESGPGARPMNPEWVRALRDQCVAAGVAFFMKQMGGIFKSRMPPIPDDLMIREFPV